MKLINEIAKRKTMNKIVLHHVQLGCVADDIAGKSDLSE